MQTLIPLIEKAGYVGIFLMLFAETGLFFGFVFPGDTLLFAAGLLASQGYFSISLILIISIIAAVLGDAVGYWTGRKIGPAFMDRKDSFWVRKAHIARAKVFFDKHGNKTIVLARFVPIVRTFSPVIAGVVEMPYIRFALFNIIGALVWCMSVPLLGYFLGTRVPNIDAWILPIVISIFVLSFIPVAFEFVRGKIKRQ